MLYLLGLTVTFGVVVVALYLLPAFVFRVLEWDDIRSALLHYAYKSFTYDGDVIPGVRPSLGTRLVIRLLSRKDEAKRALVAKAMASSKPRRSGRDAGIGGAITQARRIPTPPRGAQFRAR